jgi:SAM-dependent methyltransferase
MSVIWHDLECGPYGEDLTLWRSIAAKHDGPILEIGAGTGRVALDLARQGHHVTALDRDADLLAVLEQRAAGLGVETVLADARSFALDRTFGVCLVPMQTIQLLGGPEGRSEFLSCARAHLRRSGLLAAALTSSLEPYEISDHYAPVPDMCERDGVVYASQPTAIRARDDGFVLERRRETVAPDGRRTVENDSIALDRVSPRELEREARKVGFTALRRTSVAPTHDYVGSEVVILRA